MNPMVIEKKIESLIHCLSRIKARKPDSAQQLMKDFDLQDIISVNLERSIQISVDIAAMMIAERGLKPASTMAGAFIVLEAEGIITLSLSAKLQKSVGFRNISVHEYHSIDWELVFDIISNHMVNFQEYIQSVTRSLE